MYWLSEAMHVSSISKQFSSNSDFMLLDWHKRWYKLEKNTLRSHEDVEASQEATIKCDWMIFNLFDSTNSSGYVRNLTLLAWWLNSFMYCWHSIIEIQLKYILLCRCTYFEYFCQLEFLTKLLPRPLLSARPIEANDCYRVYSIVVFKFLGSVTKHVARNSLFVSICFSQRERSAVKYFSQISFRMFSFIQFSTNCPVKHTWKMRKLAK